MSSDENTEEKALCAMPWIHSAVQSNGDLRVCCECIYEPWSKAKKADGTNYNAKSDTVSSARNADVYKNMRKQMLKGKRPPDCYRCWKREDAGLESRRQQVNSWYHDDLQKVRDVTYEDGSIAPHLVPVRFYDLRLGNGCNLKCQACGPQDSSLWYDDYAKLNFSGKDKIEMPYSGKKYPLEKTGTGKWDVMTNDFKWHENSPYIEEIKKNLGDVDRFYFTGGEPMINEPHWGLLQACVESGNAKHIRLDYHTNFTILPRKAFDIWSHFKGVGLSISVDGVGKVNEYLRPPSKWSRILTNFERLEAGPYNIGARLAPTLSVYNVLHFIELTKWSLQSPYTKLKRLPSTNILDDPKYMSICVFHKREKDQIAKAYIELYEWIEKNQGIEMALTAQKRFSGIIKHMYKEDRSHLLSKLLTDTQRLDCLRNVKIQDALPTVNQMIQCK